jgi:hypothetical protein
MTAIIGRADTPELDESHLLACVCCFEELELGRKEGGSIYAMSGQDYFSCELIGLWGFGGRSRRLLGGKMCRVVVVLSDGVRIWSFNLRGLFLDLWCRIHACGVMEG